MLVQRFLGQPTDGNVVGELAAQIGSAEFDSMAAAVAYVTVSGTSDLLSAAPMAGLEQLDKRWLVGIDWFRSDPLALRTLDGLVDSNVRVFDGAEVIRRTGCVPRLPFHPKVWIFSGQTARALVSGSANLSGNGLSRGFEANTSTIVSNPSTAAERDAWAMIDGALSWFDQHWRRATSFGSLSSDYALAHAAQQVARPTPTEDDAVESPYIGARANRFNQLDLMKLRSSQNFWVQAGALSRNRGPGNPGNQVMLRPFSRVFFGFPARDVPTDTFIGHLSIEIGGVEHPDRTLRYSNNSMDVLTVPVPGTSGAPPAYDHETLLFRRVTNSTGRVRFMMSLAGPGDDAEFRRRSRDVGGHWRMSGGGREFGVF